MSGIWHTSTFRQELAFLRGGLISPNVRKTGLRICNLILRSLQSVVTPYAKLSTPLCLLTKNTFLGFNTEKAYLVVLFLFYVHYFPLTQRFGGSVLVVNILRLRDHLLKSHRASRITVRVRAQTGLRLGSNPPVCIFDRRATTSSQTLQLHSLSMTNVIRSTTVTGFLSPSTVWRGCLCVLLGRMLSFGIWRLSLPLSLSVSFCTLSLSLISLLLCCSVGL